MVCIQCGAETKVTNSRHQKRANQVWRRRQCLSCGAVFTTEEKADYGAAWQVSGWEGHLEPFSRDKLLLSLYDSLRHRPTALRDAGGLVETVISRLVEHVSSGTIDARMIAQISQVALNRFDSAASISYQAFHA
jgi:transcriptional repressor NrdR